MTKRKIKTIELGTVPLLVRIGEASRLFGIGRPQLMGMVKAGKGLVKAGKGLVKGWYIE